MQLKVIVRVISQTVKKAINESVDERILARNQNLPIFGGLIAECRCKTFELKTLFLYTSENSNIMIHLNFFF